MNHFAMSQAAGMRRVHFSAHVSDILEI